MLNNKLIVKDVDFFGDTLKAASDESGIVWAGVKWLCDGIGLSEGQRQRQTTNIQSDIVLSKGVANLQLPTKGGNQEVLCLQLDYVPLWLAKISITPDMRENNPELVEKLVNYQLKAKDVLAAAFLPKRSRRKPIKQKDAIMSYVRGDDIIIVIGEYVYVIEPDDSFLLSKFESKLREMGVNQIPDIIKAYISVRFEKLEGGSLISDND